MIEKSVELTLCPSCGSTEYLPDYPVAGASICLRCGHGVVSVRLKEIQEDHNGELRFSAKYVCPSCHKQGFPDDFASVEDITVYKCRSCGALDGYRVLPETFASSEELNDGGFGLKSAALAKQEGHLIFSATVSEKIAEKFERLEKDPIVLCQKQFKRLVDEKNSELGYLGVIDLAVEHAQELCIRYIAACGPFTKKQLELLFPAAVVFAQDELVRLKIKSSKVSDRKVSLLFNANRMTTRKWKKMLGEFKNSR